MPLPWVASQRAPVLSRVKPVSCSVISVRCNSPFLNIAIPEGVAIIMESDAGMKSVICDGMESLRICFSVFRSMVKRIEESLIL